MSVLTVECTDCHDDNEGHMVSRIASNAEWIKQFHSKIVTQKRWLRFLEGFDGIETESGEFNLGK